MSILEDLARAVIEGDARRAQALTRQALDEGASPTTLFVQGLVPAMDLVGHKMRANEYFIPEVLMSAKAMKAAVAILEPLLAVAPDHRVRGTVVLGTALGDMHDIGKNLVALMLRGAGFQVVDLGIDVRAERFVDAVKETGADVVGISALLTTTMVHMKDVVDSLARAGLRDGVKVMIGGAPVTQRFADDIGVDGQAGDAAGAVELARGWVG